MVSRGISQTKLAHAIGQKLPSRHIYV